MGEYFAYLFLSCGSQRRQCGVFGVVEAVIHLSPLRLFNVLLYSHSNRKLVTYNGAFLTSTVTFINSINFYQFLDVVFFFHFTLKPLVAKCTRRNWNFAKYLFFATLHVMTSKGISKKKYIIKSTECMEGVTYQYLNVVRIILFMRFERDIEASGLMILALWNYRV